MPFVVESPVTETMADGSEGRQGTFRVYVGTEERAAEIASGAPGRTYREVPAEQMPATARARMFGG